MKKRGQAFLITAVIFIAIISAFITIHNFSKKTTFTTFYYVADEIQIESEKVMDYSLINNDYSKVDDFTQDISDYVKKEDIDVYFIEDSSGSLSCYSHNINAKTCDLTTNGNEITATIDGTNYILSKYPEGKHFYFIMSKEKGDERYVYTNA